MSAPAKLNFKLYQGSTFNEVLRWESPVKVYKPITAITKSAPCVVTTSEDHNLPIGWRFRVVGAGGMKEINSSSEDYYTATGNVTESPLLEQTWLDQEALWVDLRDQDAATIAPRTRPWAGLASSAAYPILMQYTAPAGTPAAPSNMPPVLNSAINAYNNWQEAIALPTRTIEINQVNSLLYTTYTSGGVVEYNKPIDMTGYTARMQLRSKLDSSTVIEELTTENDKIVIDNVNKTIKLLISATTTAAYTFSSAVYSLEVISSGGQVTPFANGTITLVKEVTR